MSELQTKDEAQTEDFTDALSDEALTGDEVDSRFFVCMVSVACR